MNEIADGFVLLIFLLQSLATTFSVFLTKKNGGCTLIVTRVFTEGKFRKPAEPVTENTVSLETLQGKV